MMKNLLFVVLLSCLFLLPLNVCAYSGNIVASLDERNITVDDLKTYVDEVAGQNYAIWLNDREGLRKLADFYINRSLLIDYARQNVAPDDMIVTNHSARSVDQDVMYLSALLKAEVQDKAQVTEDDVHAYMSEKKIASEKQARQELETERKNELMSVLVEKVRRGHEIRYYY